MRSQTSVHRHIVLLAAIPTVAAMLGMQSGCNKIRSWTAKPEAMHSAPGVPASQGTVKATLGDNGNTNVALRVKHLAPPSKIAPEATVYVVWIQPLDGTKQNVGALTLNDDLEGSLDTLTPHKRFQISVTPEPSGLVAQPTHDPVFTYEVESSK